MAIVSLIACSSCSSSSRDDPNQLVLTGSSTVAPLATEIARLFEAQNPGMRVDVQTGGSSRGIADARRGLADVGMVSRNLKPTEADLIAHPIARDGICIIVHGKNPVESLTSAQIASIYRGELDNWRAVGGPDAPIVVVNKAAGRSTLELFLEHFKLDAADVQADVVIGDNEQGVKTVAGNPHAIGYVSIGTAEYDAEAGAAIRLLPLDGVDPSVASVQNGAWPLARTLNLVTNKRPEGLAKRFIEFARSSDVHNVVRKQYFVPLAE